MARNPMLELRAGMLLVLSNLSHSEGREPCVRRPVVETALLLWLWILTWKILGQDQRTV